jgi:type IV secretion system protein VirB9
MKSTLLAGVALATAAAAHAQSVPSSPPSAASPVAQAGDLTTPQMALAPPPIPTVIPVRDVRRPATPAELRVRAANRQAAREPVARGFVNAVQVYQFSEGALYRLIAAPERVTDIALQPGEAIVSVAAGDTVRWTVGDTTSGSGSAKQAHILVKPFAAGLSTNLIITTDRRTYHLQLESAGTAMAGLSWSYPQDELLAIRRLQAEAEAATPVASGLAVERLNFDYVVSGDKPAWRPLRAFDDGRQTFIEFGPGFSAGEAPPLFVIGERGEAQLVNYRLSGRFYVVDRLFNAAELRLGGKRQSIVRISRSAAAKGRRKS